MYLHGRRRQQQERQRPFLDPVQEFEQAIRSPFTGKSGGLSAGVVRFVNDDDIPRLGLLGEFRDTFATTHQVAGGNDERLFMPVSSGDGLFK